MGFILSYMCIGFPYIQCQIASYGYRIALYGRPGGYKSPLGSDDDITHLGFHTSPVEWCIGVVVSKPLGQWCV